MVSHKFGMRSDARTFNLSGMGCSAGVISLDLAKVMTTSCCCEGGNNRAGWAKRHDDGGRLTARYNTVPRTQQTVPRSKKAP